METRVTGCGGGGAGVRRVAGAGGGAGAGGSGNGSTSLDEPSLGGHPRDDAAAADDEEDDDSGGEAAGVSRTSTRPTLSRRQRPHGLVSTHPESCECHS